MKYTVNDIQDVLMESILDFDKEHEEKLRLLAERFKNENYNHEMKIKYYRLKELYHSKYRTIILHKNREIINANKKYELNRQNVITHGYDSRYLYTLRLKQSMILSDIQDKYNKLLKNHIIEYRHAAEEMGLKWCYIKYDDFKIL